MIVPACVGERVFAAWASARVCGCGCWRCVWVCRCVVCGCGFFFWNFEVCSFYFFCFWLFSFGLNFFVTKNKKIRRFELFKLFKRLRKMKQIRECRKCLKLSRSIEFSSHASHVSIWCHLLASYDEYTALVKFGNVASEHVK